MVSDIFGLFDWLGLSMPPGQPLSPGFQILNFLAKLYINSHHFKKKFRQIKRVISEK